MKKFLLTGIALCAFAGPAVAADLRVRTPAPVYRAPPPVVTYYNWSGCYVGGHVGGLWAKKDWRYVSAPTGVASGSHDFDDWLGGLQAGCNYQVGTWVFGIQGDYSWTDADGSHTDLVTTTIANFTSIKSLASVTGRIGYAWDRFLGYVKAGGAWEHDDYRRAVAGVTFATASETRSGWTVGVGGEYAFTNWLTGFVEYDYYDFGDRNVTFSNGQIFTIDERKHVVKGGLNLKFDWGGWSGRF